MKQEEALELVKQLKSGREIRIGHYAAGYEQFKFQPTPPLFIYRREDTAVEIYNPSVEEQRFKEQEFIAFLVKNFQYKDIV